MSNITFIHQSDIYMLQSYRKGMVYLTTRYIYYIYGYIASNIWERTTQIVREETRCRHYMGYSSINNMSSLYAPFHRQDRTYYDLLYQSWRSGWKKKKKKISGSTIKDRSDDPSHYQGVTSCSCKVTSQDCENKTTLATRRGKEGRKEMFYLTTHSTHFIYGYMASDIW